MPTHTASSPMKPTHRPRVTEIAAYTHPGVAHHELYQLYFRESLKQACAQRRIVYREIPVGSLPGFRHLAGSFADSYTAGRLFPAFTSWVKHSLEGSAEKHSSRLPGKAYHPFVGQYTVKFDYAENDTTQVKTTKQGHSSFYIDSHDSPDLQAPELCRAGTYYFKTNRWGDRTYPPQAAPLPHANPFILPHIPTLRGLRDREKEFDLCCIMRVWGGADEESGIEHNLKLLRMIKQLPLHSDILAYLVTSDSHSLGARLTQEGIPWTTTPLPSHELWARASRAQVNLIRLGMHYCVPWRMTDLLCMGACIALDRAPYSEWPSPLIEGTHYHSLQINVGPDSPVASHAEYDRAGERLLTLCSAAHRTSTAAAEYFDTALQPAALGEQILSSLEARFLKATLTAGTSEGHLPL